MLNAADIVFDHCGIEEVSLYRKPVVIIDAESIERAQKNKRGKHHYQLIAYTDELFDAMVDENLSFKIARSGIRG